MSFVKNNIFKKSRGPTNVACLSKTAPYRQELNNQITPLKSKTISISNDLNQLQLQYNTHNNFINTFNNELSKYQTITSAQQTENKILTKVNLTLRNYDDSLKQDVIPSEILKQMTKNSFLNNQSSNSVTNIQLTDDQTNYIINQCYTQASNKLAAISSNEANTAMTKFEETFYTSPKYLKLVNDIKTSKTQIIENSKTNNYLYGKVNDINSIGKEQDQLKSDVKIIKADLRQKIKDISELSKRLTAFESGLTVNSRTNQIELPTKAGENPYLDSLVTRLETIESTLSSSLYNTLSQSLESLNTKTDKNYNYFDSLSKDTRGLNVSVRRVMEDINLIRTRLENLIKEGVTTSELPQSRITVPSIDTSAIDSKINTLENILTRIQTRVSEAEGNLINLSASTKSTRSDLNNIDNKIVTVVKSNINNIMPEYDQMVNLQNKFAQPTRISQLENDIRQTKLTVAAVQQDLDDIEKAVNEDQNNQNSNPPSNIPTNRFNNLHRRLTSVNDRVEGIFRDSIKQTNKLNDITSKLSSLETEVDNENYVEPSELKTKLDSMTKSISDNVNKIKLDLRQKRHFFVLTRSCLFELVSG